MTRDLEPELREHLRVLDSIAVASPDDVGVAVSRSATRRARQRRLVAGTAGVALAGGLVGLLSLRGPGTPIDSAATSPEPISTPLPSTAPTQPASTLDAPTVSVDHGPASEEQTIWTAMAPDPRGMIFGSSVVWMDDEALVIDGQMSAGRFASGVVRYRPETNSWTDVERPASLGAAIERIVVWTGSEALVIGGLAQSLDETKAGDLAYDPVADEWRAIAPAPGALSAASASTWTGRELLAWPDGAIAPARYSPGADTWTPTSPPPISWRSSATSVWTGTEWTIWGGHDGTTDHDDGAAYNPVTDVWRMIAPSPLSARRTEGMWTGDEVLIMAGSSGNLSSPFAHADGAAYDPTTDTWRPLADGFAHPGFRGIWTGTLAVMFAKGGGVTYDPALDRWDDLCCNEAGPAAGLPLWTGEQILSFGSWNEPALGGVVIAPPPGYASWAKPDRFPQLEPGAPCPVATAVSSPSSDLAPMLGEGPVRLVGWTGTFDIAPAENYGSDTWGGNKAIWAVDESVGGPVVLTGRQLDGPADVRFGAGAEPAARLVIDVSERSGLDGGWRDWPDALRLSGPGCYGIHIETISGWEMVVFEAVAG